MDLGEELADPAAAAAGIWAAISTGLFLLNSLFFFCAIIASSWVKPRRFACYVALRKSSSCSDDSDLDPRNAPQCSVNLHDKVQCPCGHRMITSLWFVERVKGSTMPRAPHWGRAPLAYFHCFRPHLGIRLGNNCTCQTTGMPMFLRSIVPGN